MHQGKVFFEKKLTASSLPPRSLLTLPTLFVKQHADKIHEYVALRNVANGKMWTVKINVTCYHNRPPQAYFHRGWKDFLVSNDLVIGDRLAFVLVKKSLFHVFLLRIGVSPRLPAQEPNLRSHNPLPAQRETKMSPVPQHGCQVSAGGWQKSENPLSGTQITNNTAVESHVAKGASDSPDSSPSSFDRDSHYFQPMVQQMELECVSKAVNNSAGDDQGQSKLPYFLKRTTMSSAKLLEIPVSFLTTNYTRLGTRVQLQGIRDDSPACTVDCCSVNNKGRRRVFFREGWSHFMKENALRVGQRLAFTLTADSFFVVRSV